MASPESPLISHIEAFLGHVECGWTPKLMADDLWASCPHGEKQTFHLVKCRGGRVGDAKAFCTVGLSKYALPSVVSNKTIRHELVILMPDSMADQNIPAILQQLGSKALKRNSAYLHGEVMRGGGAILKGKPFSAFYATRPNILPKAFHTFLNGEGSAVVFVWMVPITTAEADFIKANGWGKFEDILESNNADMMNLERTSYVKA